MRLLLCTPSPRDIKDFKKAIEKLPYDIYWAKYYPQYEAYGKCRAFFLSRDYDVMALIPDDLLVHEEGLKLLIEDVEKYPNTVVSGICNFDANYYSNKYCFRREGSYQYPEIAKLDEYLEKAIEKYPFLYRVEFNGFACPLIPRSVLEYVTDHNWGDGAGIDQRFADNCRKKSIDVLVDIRVRFNHLADRLKNGTFECWGVGIKGPKELFSPFKS